jgi:hypothetical protein
MTESVRTSELEVTLPKVSDGNCSQVERSYVTRIERTPRSLRDRKPVTNRPLPRLPIAAQRTRRRNDFSTWRRMT